MPYPCPSVFIRGSISSTFDRIKINQILKTKARLSLTTSQQGQTHGAAIHAPSQPPYLQPNFLDSAIIICQNGPAPSPR